MVFRLYRKQEKRKGYVMKKAMVFGAGVSGLGAEHLLKNMGYEVILVDDKKGISSKDMNLTLKQYSPDLDILKAVLHRKHLYFLHTQLYIQHIEAIL